MPAPVISVRDLSKCYHLGATLGHDTLRDHISHAARSVARVFRGKTKSAGYGAADHIWALKNVSFDVQPGEVLGIVGRNGAGKSTLLKVLSRITEPTEGEVRIRGRMAGLLEVGTGFHQELTGRENIYLNGAILGMTKSEINRKFGEIVAFAEVEKFLDTPVKRYSSGMYVRLAFAVAAHLEPEILLVDEVLAVGDANFRKKCLGKMSDVARAGRTIFFVSHNMLAIQSLCSRVLWINEGRIAEDGPAAPIIARYLQSTVMAATECAWEKPDSAPGGNGVKLRRVAVRPVGADSAEAITIQTPFTLEFEYWNLEPDSHLHLAIHVLDNTGTCVFASNSVREPRWHGRPQPPGIFRSVCHVPRNLLNDGTYRVKLYVVKDKSNILFIQDDVLVFDVIDDLVEGRAAWLGKWPGLIRPNLNWETELVADENAASASSPQAAATSSK